MYVTEHKVHTKYVNKYKKLNRMIKTSIKMSTMALIHLNLEIYFIYNYSEFHIFI